MPNTPRFQPGTGRRVAVLTYPGVLLLDVAGPIEVFASANDMARAAGEPEPYDVHTLSREGRVRSTADVILETRPLPDHSIPYDTLIVAGGLGVDAMLADEILIDWLDTAARSARRTASVCSGAFLLAATGLLDGRRAVTHWGRCPQFRELYPAVKLEPDPIFIRDGNLWTSAGITAGIDLALALVEEDLGRERALAIARELVVFLKRPGGQSQFSTMLDMQTGSGSFDALHVWIMKNLRGDLSLPRLAEQAHMSPRSFSRHYRQVTGRTPAKAIETMRVEAAKRMLETRKSVVETARRCGFGSVEAMRRSFLRVLSVNPADYRERFSLSEPV